MDDCVVVGGRGWIAEWHQAGNVTPSHWNL
jgi:hypothetical protein